MNLIIIGGQVVIMISCEIVDFVGLCYDNVCVIIEWLVECGVIVLFVMQEKFIVGCFIQEYVFIGDQGKCDSIIVVVQFCLEFIVWLVDCWQELEQQVFWLLIVVE